MQDQEPFEGYNGMIVPQVLERLKELSPDEVSRVQEYEAAHENRKGIASYQETQHEAFTPPGRPPLAEVAEGIASTEEEQAEQLAAQTTTPEEGSE
jgi:hypothetical protein